MEEKKRIIFVDDEPNILSAMKRLLRPLRKGLDVSYTESAKEALTLMAKQPFDVIVSDMRMPGMDGAELLTIIKDKYPETIRIMLTGQAGDELIMRTVNVAHQFLTKPCEPERLKLTLHKACLLHNLLTHQLLRTVVSQITSLPSLPAIYQEIQRLLADPDSSVDDVANCIVQDMSMSAKILQLVNSAFFGLFQNIESPQQAVHLLGLDTIKSLALSVKIFSEFENQDLPSLSLDTLWRHSMIVGTFAKKIAEAETADKAIINDSFVAGLQHDIGILILIANLPAQYQQVIDIVSKDNSELFEAENQIFKASHAEIGAYLLGIWGFSSPVIEAIAYHHRPSKYPEKSFTALTAVHVANVLANELHNTMVVGAKSTFDLEYLQKIGCSDKLGTWRELCKQENGESA